MLYIISHGPYEMCIAFSAYGANGAIIHYRPEPESCSPVGDKKLFLLDSGAQYVDGTTDITRTVHFGEPTVQQRECFTRVLQVLYNSLFYYLIRFVKCSGQSVL